jgi:hypothetical protein
MQREENMEGTILKILATNKRRNSAQKIKHNTMSLEL